MADERCNGSLMTLGEDLELDGDTLASRDGTAAGAEAPVLPPGAQAGRYMILDQLGRGGMGVVYKAYDPELDRRVALKLLSVKKGSQSQADRARDRLLREAKALAQLSHPNVVSAYDVGMLDQDVFVAMELVEGKTLKEWVAQEKPSIWRRVEMLIAAGRGISAAHKAGLVHRDIKPDNIIVGDDGRVRVLDFGLARAAMTEPAAKVDEAQPAMPVLTGDVTSGGSFLSTPMTQAGTIVGTPGYMAPEQYLGGPVDEQSDQYSFCVTVYEMLFGLRPHRARRFGELKKKVLAGRPDPVPPEAKVPARYRRIVQRGMAVAKEERFASMEQLLAELAKDPRVQRRRVLGLVAILMLIGASFAGAYVLQSQRQQLCEGSQARFTGIWDQGRRQQIRAAFVATGRPHALDTYQRVAKVLDGRAAQWAAMHQEACQATHVRGEQSEALLDKRMQCLARRLSEINALTDLFAEQADDKVVDKAAAAAYGLASLDACADIDGLLAAVAPPQDARVRGQVEGLREKLDTARAWQKAGKFPQSLAQVSALQQKVEQTKYLPLRAEWLFEMGGLQADSGDFELAKQSLQQAILFAARAHDDVLRARATITLIHVTGHRQSNYTEARAIGRLAQADVARAGDEPILRARLLSRVGTVMVHQGQYPEAQEKLEQAMSLFEQSLGKDHPQVAAAHSGIAHVLFKQGHYDKARVQLERVLAIQQRSLGPEHPNVAKTLNNLGGILVGQDKLSAARKVYQRSLVIKEKVLGPRHPNVAYTLNNLGDIHLTEEDYQGGLALFERALDIWQEALGPKDRLLAFALTGLGKCLTGLEQAKRALVPLERALALREHNPGGPNDLASTKFALAQALWHAHQQRARAVKLAQQALALYGHDSANRRTNYNLIVAWLKKKGPVDSAQ